MKILDNIKSIIYWTLILFLIVVLFDFLWTSRNEIAGIYVNNNIESIFQGPKSTKEGIDTLRILADNRFINSCWGIGNYSIKNSLFTTEVEFTYKGAFGYTVYSSKINRPIFDDLKIWLNRDLNYYYKRVEEFN